MQSGAGKPTRPSSGTAGESPALASTQTPEKGDKTHDGYLVFRSNGQPVHWTLRKSRLDAINKFRTSIFPLQFWENHVERGCSVRPVLITEIEE